MFLADWVKRTVTAGESVPYRPAKARGMSSGLWTADSLSQITSIIRPARQLPVSSANTASRFRQDSQAVQDFDRHGARARADRSSGNQSGRSVPVHNGERSQPASGFPGGSGHAKTSVAVLHQQPQAIIRIPSTDLDLFTGECRCGRPAFKFTQALQAGLGLVNKQRGKHWTVDDKPGMARGVPAAVRIMVDPVPGLRRTGGPGGLGRRRGSCRSWPSTGLRNGQGGASRGTSARRGSCPARPGG